MEPSFRNQLECSTHITYIRKVHARPTQPKTATSKRLSLFIEKRYERQKNEVCKPQTMTARATSNVE